MNLFMHTRNRDYVRLLLLLVACDTADSALRSAPAPTAPAPAASAGRTEVFVLGTLYKRHQSVPAYDLPTLRRIVLAIKPDVLVLDCTPREVEEQAVSPGKIEYPGVIFPLIRDGAYRVYAAEPREPMFSEIVRAVVQVHEAFRKTRPEAAAAFDQFQTGTYAALMQHWQSPAEVNDDVTGDVLSAKKALEGHLVGPAEADGWTRWNRHWTDTIMDAVAHHAGRRILAVTGIENRPWIVAALRKEPRVTVIDMPGWLRSHASEMARMPDAAASSALASKEKRTP
jgi:hypothetical protein